jgi:hypothetical protein
LGGKYNQSPSNHDKALCVGQKKLKCFFECGYSQTQTPTEQREYDHYYTCYFPPPITRTQIPPPGYGTPPAIPFGNNTPSRFEENNPELGVWMPNTIQECLESRNRSPESSRRRKGRHGTNCNAPNPNKINKNATPIL